jgi:hypothetical protein
MNALPFEARPQPTQEAWAGAYLRHLIDRTGETPERIADHFYCEVGCNPEQDWHGFHRWLRACLMAVDRGGDPFTTRRTA